MRIGIPRESKAGETLVAATAKTATQLVKLGYDVVVESGAGTAADQPDSAFTDAEIAATRPRVQAGIVKALGRPVFVKTHNANARDHGFPIINMAASAGAVYIVRNPLDVAISFAAFSATTIDEVIGSMGTPGSARASCAGARPMRGGCRMKR